MDWETKECPENEGETLGEQNREIHFPSPEVVKDYSDGEYFHHLVLTYITTTPNLLGDDWTYHLKSMAGGILDGNRTDSRFSALTAWWD